LPQYLLDGPSFFGVVSHVTAVDSVLTQQVLVFIGFDVLVLNSHVKIYDNEFLNRMFDLELPKFRADLERIYGRQPLELINVNTTSMNVFSNLQNCPITINVVDPRAILGVVVDVATMPKVFFILTFFSMLILIVIS